MQLTVLIGLIIMISPILGDQEQEQAPDQIDYYDGDVYFDAPVLKPSEFSVEELANPYLGIEPEATLTFNYDKVINGQSPQPVEKRKESVKHYLRIRKPTKKRVIYHIKRNKPDEDGNLATSSDKTMEIKNSQLDIPPPVIPISYQEDDTSLKPSESIITPDQQNNHSYNNTIYPTTQTTTEVAYSASTNSGQSQIALDVDKDQVYPLLVTQNQETIRDLSLTTPLFNYAEIQAKHKLPRQRMNTKQNSRKNKQSRITESFLQTTVPTISTKNDTSSSTYLAPSVLRNTDRNKFQNVKSLSPNVLLSGQKRAQGRKWLQTTTSPISNTEDISSTTPYYKNKFAVPLMRFRIRKWPASEKLTMPTPSETLTVSNIEQQSVENVTGKMASDIITSDNRKTLINESLSTKNPKEVVATTILPINKHFYSENKSPQHNEPRNVRRKLYNSQFESTELQKTSSENDQITQKSEVSTIKATTIDSLSQSTELQKMSSEDDRITQKPEVTTTESITSGATSEDSTPETKNAEATTRKHSKRRRNFGRSRLRARPRTNTTEVNNVSPLENTDIHTVSDLETTTKPLRMRYRNRLRKVKVNELLEGQEVSPSTDQIIISSPTLTGTARQNLKLNSTEININNENLENAPEKSEGTLQRKPEKTFSKNNPPPHVPTLSPWFDGFGK